MKKFQSCPVCGKEQIQADQVKCPQCNADLACFRVLDALMPEQQKIASPGWKSKIIDVMAIGLVIIVLLLLGWLWYQGMRIDRQNLQIMQLLGKNEQKLEQYRKAEEDYYLSLKDWLKVSQKKEEAPPPDSAQTQAEEVKEPEEVKKPKDEGPKFFIYRTRGMDTLWNISERFYGQGRYYAVLIAMNPEVNIFKIKAGEQLKILQRKEDVIQIFNQLVEKTGPVIFFWYQVQKGDIIDSLSRKFYKPADYYLIHKLNPNIRFEAGQRIKILLRSY